jgi:hypothetical protein
MARLSGKSAASVIPAQQAGIPFFFRRKATYSELDARLRGHDDL